MELLRMGIDGLHEPGFQVSRPNGYPHYLFLLIKTPAVFIINNQEFKANRNSVIIYDINSPITIMLIKAITLMIGFISMPIMAKSSLKIFIFR